MRGACGPSAKRVPCRAQWKGKQPADSEFLKQESLSRTSCLLMGHAPLRPHDYLQYFFGGRMPLILCLSEPASMAQQPRGRDGTQRYKPRAPVAESPGSGPGGFCVHYALERGAAKDACFLADAGLVRTWIGSKPGSKEKGEQQEGLCHGTRADGSSIAAARRRSLGPEHTRSSFGAVSLAPGLSHRVSVRL